MLGKTLKAENPKTLKKIAFLTTRRCFFEYPFNPKSITHLASFTPIVGEATVTEIDVNANKLKRHRKTLFQAQPKNVTHFTTCGYL